MSYKQTLKTINQIMEKQKDKKIFDKKPTFELLMQKFQFHNNVVQHHAHLAKFIGEQLRADYPKKTKDSGYFTEEFFEENNKPDGEEADTSATETPETSGARQPLH